MTDTDLKFSFFLLSFLSSMCSFKLQVSLWGILGYGVLWPSDRVCYLEILCPQVFVQNGTLRGKGPTFLTHGIIAWSTLLGKSSNNCFCSGVCVLIPCTGIPALEEKKKVVHNLYLTTVKKTKTTIQALQDKQNSPNSWAKLEMKNQTAFGYVQRNRMAFVLLPIPCVCQCSCLNSIHWED